jgi:hypothetical protein
MRKSKLTVIIRDESPLFIQEPVVYRSVQILLTAEQQEQLKLRETWICNGIPVFETISQCFLEEE